MAWDGLSPVYSDKGEPHKIHPKVRTGISTRHRSRKMTFPHQVPACLSRVFRASPSGNWGQGGADRFVEGIARHTRRRALREPWYPYRKVSRRPLWDSAQETPLANGSRRGGFLDAYLWKHRCCLITHRSLLPIFDGEIVLSYPFVSRESFLNAVCNSPSLPATYSAKFGSNRSSKTNLVLVAPGSIFTIRRPVASLQR
jgi:hypothetical protein